MRATGKSLRRLWLVGVPIGLLCAAVASLLIGTGADNAFAYSKLVHEVVGNPAAYEDRELRVEGELKQGSLLFREQPCEWRFVLTKNGAEMPVRFPECVVPDTLRDGKGISITVQGRVERDGSFTANQVVPRCPSKYEQQERLRRGEPIPHASTAPAPNS